MRVTLTPIEDKASSTPVTLEPLYEKEQGSLDLFGKGLAHGTLGLAESVGTGLEYLGAKAGSWEPPGPNASSRRFGDLRYIYDSPEKIEREDERTKRFMHEKVAPVLTEIGTDTSGYWGEKAKPYEMPEKLQGSIIDDPALLKNPAWWAYSVAEIIPSFAASMVPGAGAARSIQVGGKLLRLTPSVISKLARIGGAVAGGLSGGALEGAGTYREVIKRGGTPKEAARAAELMTLASAGLNAISVGKVLGPATGVTGKVKHIAGSALTEAITEYLEEPSEAAILGDDIITALKEGANVIPPTLLTGGLGGFAATTRQMPKEVAPKAPVEEVTLTPVEEILAEGEGLKKEYQSKKREEAAKAAPETVTLEPLPEEPALEPNDKGENPTVFNKGDTVKNVNTDKTYEVIESDKRGMSQLKNLKTGEVEDWNAYNNPNFVNTEDQTSRKPRIIVEKARIDITPAGVKATSIGKPEVYEGGEQVVEEKKSDVGTVEHIDTVALSNVFKAEIDRGERLNKFKVHKLVADSLDVKVSELKNNRNYNYRSVEEAFEYAVIKKGREVALSDLSGDEKFAAIKTVYKNQPNLSQRTSSSIAGQQYLSARAIKQPLGVI